MNFEEMVKIILLVEDEAIISIIAVKALRRFGYKVISVNSGEKAVELTAKDEKINLILMDINLGEGIDGTEAARQILAVRNIPIVFHTSHSERDMVEKVRGITRYGYVVKSSGDFVLQSSLELAFELFEANNKIVNSEAKQKALISNISDVIAIIDLEGINKYKSPNIEKWFGWKPEELIGSSTWENVHPEDLKFMQNFIGGLMGKPNASGTAECRYQCRDGSFKWIEITVVNLLHDPVISGILGNYHDITDRKKSEEEIRTKNEALNSAIEQMEATNEELIATNEELIATSQDMEAANEELIAAAEELQAKERVLQEMLEDHKQADNIIKSLLAEKELILKEVHHRIKNNMNTINSILTLQSYSLEDQIAINALEDAGSRVQSMMLLYDKLYLSIDFKEISPGEYISSLVDEITANFPNSKSVMIEKRIDNFALDIKKLQPVGIIINEFLTNIMKYAFIGRNDGLIKVTAKHEGGHITIEIKDNGVGIPESIDFNNSTGFGMQLVSMLTEQIGGCIRIERGEGTMFVLEFGA